MMIQYFYLNKFFIKKHKCFTIIINSIQPNKYFRFSKLYLRIILQILCIKNKSNRQQLIIIHLIFVSPAMSTSHIPLNTQVTSQVSSTLQGSSPSLQNISSHQQKQKIKSNFKDIKLCRPYQNQNILNQQSQPNTFQQLSILNIRKKTNIENKYKLDQKLGSNNNNNKLSFASLASSFKTKQAIIYSNNNIQESEKRLIRKKDSLMNEIMKKNQNHSQNFNDINYTDSKQHNNYTDNKHHNKKHQINYVQTSKSKMKSAHRKNNSDINFQCLKKNLKADLAKQNFSNKNKVRNENKNQKFSNQQNQNIYQAKSNLKFISPVTPNSQSSKHFLKDSSNKYLNVSQNIYDRFQPDSFIDSYKEVHLDSINNSINNSIRKSIDYDQISQRHNQQMHDFKGSSKVVSKIKDLSELIEKKIKFKDQKKNQQNFKNNCSASYNKQFQNDMQNLMNYSTFVQKNKGYCFANNSLTYQFGSIHQNGSNMSHKKQQQKQSLQQFVCKLQNSSHSIKNSDQVNTSFASIASYDNRSQISQKSSINFSKKFQKYKTETQQKKTITINDFKQIKVIGNGKYGKVSLVRNKKNNFICALKAVSKKIIKQQNLQIPFMRQIKIQLFLNHPNVVKLYGFFDDQNYIYLIMEYCSDGHLLKIMQAKDNHCFQEHQVLPIITDLFQAVSFLHSRGIIHRDLKPQNIVIENGVYKLCDFGWAAYSQNHMRTTFCGTPLYVSPQILKGQQYDTKTDVWGLGILTFQLIFGRVPFSLVTEHDMNKIINDPVYFPTWIVISKQMKQLIQSMLDKNARKRCTINQILSKPLFINFSKQCKQITSQYSKEINLNLIN